MPLPEAGTVTRTWHAVINPYGGQPVAMYPSRTMAERHVALYHILTGAEIVAVEITYADPGIYRSGGSSVR